MSITYSTCYYVLHSKFPKEIYIEWIRNFFSIVNHFNLVVYTNEQSLRYIPFTNNPRIKIVIKNLEEFYFYKYKQNWIENHKKNNTLKSKTCWELNMIWSEKIHFVKETIDKNYFETELHGWCDIGYFRNRKYFEHCVDSDIRTLTNWSKNLNVTNVDISKVHYGIVCNFTTYNKLKMQANKTNGFGLPEVPFQDNMICFAGGFFIAHKNKIEWWLEEYEKMLVLYFTHNYTVVHDQTIIANIILTDKSNFKLYIEPNTRYDNWFMFQRHFNAIE